MKIALLADIHGNLPALEAVLADARRRGCQAIWNAGDLVGYGPFPDAVVSRLSEIGALSVLGNYDRKVLRAGRRPARIGAADRRKRFAFLWTYAQLSDGNIGALKELPPRRAIEVDGRWALLVHGSPDSDEEYLRDSTPEERFVEISRQAAADVVIAGHTHRSLLRKAAGVWFVNPGSVGRSDDGDPRASYALLTLGPRGVLVRHQRVPYDIERTVHALRRLGLPETFAQMFLRGRPLDEVAVGETPGDVFGPAARAVGPEELRAAARAFAAGFPCDLEHTAHVVHLSLRLFDELQELHQLGGRERLWLECAAWIHDIGWSEGRKRHHKRALHATLNAETLPCDARERLIIGGIARYHRRALPNRKRHAHFAALPRRDQEVVAQLAALLRVADALDFTHQTLIPDLAIEVADHAVIVHCRSPRAMGELHAVERKGLLFTLAFGLRLQLSWDRRREAVID